MRRKLLRYFLIGFGFLTVLGVVLLASLELTSKPAFCSTCHYMEPYVQGWKTSTHKDVTCTDCHFPPGFKSKLQGKFTAISMVANYMTGIYKKSKPWAEISDASCLRSGCHEERLLFGKVLFKDKVIFDHTPHLTKLRQGKKLRCTSCHSQIVQGEHITVTETSCFLCHFKNQPEEAPINDCTWCHKAPVTTDSLEVEYDHAFVVEHEIDCKKCHGSMQVGDGAVPVERCSSCHADPETIGMYDDLQAVHRNHVTEHKVECQFCHLVIQHKSVEKTKDVVLNCDSCHDNTHKAQINLLSGKGGKNTPPHPNPMFKDGLTCQACHIFHSADGEDISMSQTKGASALSCETCHGEGYNRLLENWKSIMSVKIQFIDSLYTVVSKEVDGKHEGISKEYAKSLMNDAMFNYELVKQGNVVHNVAYSDELIVSAFENLKESLKAINSETVLPGIKLSSQNVPSSCYNCHFGQEEFNSVIFGLEFSHNLHIEKNRIACSKCHSSQRRHGEMHMSKTDCRSCHHEKEKNCDTCHNLQYQFFSGTTGMFDDETPDVMYEEELECRACHDAGDGIVQKSNATFCVDCHDDEYEILLQDWQYTTEKSIDDLLSDLDSFDSGNLPGIQQTKIKEIRFGVMNIRLDKSKGAHNIELKSRLLEHYHSELDMIIGK